ncbi:hypothetical protein [Paludisphaera rhizosphaerae]|uniref:hypothetical protein n=1 Tax=Paludisphaera rhizosphaerae TaxID=2711216 RepID=UPI0013EB35C0|nr:hypothetical protein [Paludisphaera rhizosphaerae]
MIAQDLERGRPDLAAASRSIQASTSNDARGFHVGVRCVHVGLAILLLPALATVLVVGGLGAGAIKMAAVVSRVVHKERSSTL